MVPSHAAGVKIGVSTRTKPFDIEVIANRADHLVADANDRMLPAAAQPQMAAVHQEIDAVVLRRDRIRIVLGDALHDFDARDVQFVAAGRALLFANCVR